MKFFYKRMVRRGLFFALFIFTTLAITPSQVLADRFNLNSLDPRGPGAANLAELWWIMFALGTGVFVLVTGLLVAIIVVQRRRRGDFEIDLDPVRARWWIYLGGIVMPVIIIAIVFFFTVRSLVVLAEPPRPPSVTIEVIGHMWWWEVRYPDEGIVTANEIHIPVGVPVEFTVTSADVIHSFWVPQLHGKIDMIPGRTNTIWMQADEAGEYRGQCAEFCGMQHAKMAFVLVAHPETDYVAWLERERQPALAPVDALAFRGQQIFLGSACVYCHTIRGTNATGDLGPDLTHLASRRTLASGTLENNRGNLAGWIIDPQHIKPGSFMPPTYLDGPDLQALLAYLDTLR